jgi:aryl-alcohol dehydrogenase-like predicted oxidoreductase
MEYTTLGKGELEITNIVFGAWAIGGWMWGGADKNDAIDAIHTAMERGITTIDTAPVYGFGKSEEIVGEAIKGKRDKLQILTKYGLRWDTDKGQKFFASKDDNGKIKILHKYAGKEGIIKECEESLKRLGTDYIDLYQIHWPDVTTPVEESMEAVDRLIEQGKVRYSGVCNYDKPETESAFKASGIVSNQVPYSMLDRHIEAKLVPYCVENGIGILAYSPLQRGFLTGKIKPGHQFNEGDHRVNQPYFKETNLIQINAFLDEIKPIAKNHNATLSQLVINWTLQQKGITAALVGARNPEQVKENAKSLDFNLVQDELDYITIKLDNLLERIDK